MANKDFKLDELNEDELFLEDIDYQDDDDEFDDYSDDAYDEYDDEYDDDYEDEYDEYDDEYDDEYVDEVDNNEGQLSNVENIDNQKKGGSILSTLLKVILGLLVLSMIGLGSFFGYNKFIANKTETQELTSVNTGSEQQESTQVNESVASEQNGQEQSANPIQDPANASQNNEGGNVEFKYSISHAGDASDKLNRMNADFRTATSLFTQNNDLEGYKTALNNIESQRQIALSELANHESNELAEMVATQYKEFFNGLNTAFGAKTTDQAVETFNNWNNKQNEFNKLYTQKLTSMLDQAGIEWSQTETEAGLTIVY